ncbi:MAG: hypothetical protein IT531_03085 [Burkholderiales bacterium]|nr:hypothetical protein [Burkholderiales bacterium]
MTAADPRGIDLPTHWTPAQALAVFEIIELLRDQLWAAYGPAIQHALREELRSEPASIRVASDDPPF